MSAPPASMTASQLGKPGHKIDTGNFHDMQWDSEHVLGQAKGEKAQTQPVQRQIPVFPFTVLPTPQPENVIYQKELTMLLGLRKYTENFTVSPKQPEKRKWVGVRFFLLLTKDFTSRYRSSKNSPDMRSGTR